jgi:DNA polymerase-3 subunit alpha
MAWRVNYDLRQMSKPSPFVHLHLHSTFSFLDGYCRPDDLAQFAAERGTTALALTDHGNLHGAYAFSSAMRKHGIKPIIGCEIYRTKCPLGEKPEAGTKEKLNHMTLLAQNEEGWSNLCQLISIANMENFYGKPRVNDEMLAKHSAGIVCLSGCMQGRLSKAIIEGKREEAFQELDFLISVYGKERLWVEVHSHNLPDQEKLNAGLKWMAQKHDLRLCAANDVHYVRKEDALTHDFLLSVATNSDIDDPNRLRYLPCDQFFLRSAEEMREAFHGMEEALEAPNIIAESCQFELKASGTRYPQLPGMEPGQSVAMLKERCLSSISQGLVANPQEAKKRLDYELNVIANSGFSDYFHIVADIRDYARKEGISQGPGRGSAAGSLVAYLMGITDIDPLPNGLYFERFLNPDRISPPDIDMDFCHIGRGQILDYIRKRYGSDRVCQIATYQKYGPRLALRDAMRVHRIPMSEVDRISIMAPKTIDQMEPDFFEKDSSIIRECQKDPRIAKSVALAKQVVGIPRNAGVHASAIVVSPEPIAGVAPLARTNEGQAVIQADMGTVEALGLLKLDILGLKTVTVIDVASEMIKERKPDFNSDKIPNEDGVTAQLWKQSKSYGVFQVEQEEVRQFASKLPVTNRDDFALVTAVFRPGAMEQAPTLLKRRHGEEETIPLHPAIEEVTRSTNGILVYQEQVMEAARKFSGYTLGQADLLRRAMGKKKPEEMEKMKAGFIEGAEKMGHTKDEACVLFDEIEKFAGYGFNKSHAVAYATMSWRTAYIKAHYPVEFYSAIMRFEADDSARLAEAIADAASQGIVVRGPDINLSRVNFAPRDGKVMFGLAGIKGIGEAAAEAIVKLQPFNGFYETCRKILTETGGKANIKTLRALADSGALDSFGDRSDIINTLSNPKSRDLVLKSLFQDVPSSEKTRLTKQDMFVREVSACGWCFSDNPYTSYLGMRPVLDAAMIKGLPRDQDVSVLAVVLGKKAERSKKSGRPYGTVTLSDETGVLKAICFPPRGAGKNVTTDVSPEFKKLEPGKVFLLKGMVDSGGQMIIRTVGEVSETKPLSFTVMAKQSVFEPARLENFVKMAEEARESYPCRVAFCKADMKNKEVGPIKLPRDVNVFRGVLSLPGVIDVKCDLGKI